MGAEKFKNGERVKWTETGEKGVVDHHFPDDSVTVDLDGGFAAEVTASSLERVRDRVQRQDR